MLDKEYIQSHIDDTTWLKKSDAGAQLEGLVKNLLEEAKSRISDEPQDAMSFQVKVEVKPFLFGQCIEVQINGFRVGHI